MPIISGSTVIRGSRGTPVAQDANDKLITVVQGNQDIAVTQTATGELVTEMHGSEGVVVKQETTGELISVIQGSEGVDVKQKATGELVTEIVGSTGNAVAQDANDYLITVIKGLYNGSLETVALDQDHAIKAVLYDPVDDWDKTQTIGLNELASRLGAKQGYDNRGRLLWSDGFEENRLKWNKTESAGAKVTLNNEHVYKGKQSVQFELPIGFPVTGRMWKRFYSPLTGVYGIEGTWSSSKDLFSSLKFGLIIYDGTYRWNYYLDLYGAQRSFFMREEGYGSRTVGTMTCEFSDTNFWHKWKIVADTTQGKIPRVMVDGIEFDPSQYDVERIADATDPHIYVFVEVVNSSSVAMTAYVDDLVFTHLEPAD